MTLLTFIAISIIGGWITYFTSEKLHLGALKASALCTLIVSLPFEIIESPDHLSFIPALFFGASFVGMASKNIFNDLNIIIASAIFGIGYYFCQPHFNSIGGCLGTTACISCLTILGCKKLFLLKRS